MKRTVLRWHESTEPYWMTHAVPQRHGRTAEAFRFATAATLRLAAEHFGDGLEFFRDVGNHLDEKPMVWDEKKGRQFAWWCRVGVIPRVVPPVAGGAPLAFDPHQLVGLLAVRGPDGFVRLLDALHEINQARTTFGTVRDRRQMHFDGAVAGVFREVFGCPSEVGHYSPKRVVYRWPPRFVRAAWRTGTAVELARTMWDARDFSAMPILADALQDAGCDRDDILTHCRDPHAHHTRGCWVLDAVLGGVPT